MTKVNFSNQAESFMSESYINFMVMYIIKPENEGHIFGEWWEEKFWERCEQNWTGFVEGK